jgi:hypothetical protein
MIGHPIGLRHQLIYRSPSNPMGAAKILGSLHRRRRAAEELGAAVSRQMC